ncbi:unnamed protein product [Trypanosoma congolense IL3000]|uniref:WGS project CAEQ00000000 data, annotated contig 1931 n=1 Tax=Trypanosoma congolense (strain IL3000) TaxID=1068625 RepID=F9WA45_TRYCI|nr:unnamed protein product [Trypanosoma congolense IL3000]
MEFIREKVSTSFSFDFRPAETPSVTCHVGGLLTIEDVNLMAYFDCERKMDFVSLRQSMVRFTLPGNSDFLRASGEARGALRAEWTALEATESALHNQFNSACAHSSQMRVSTCSKVRMSSCSECNNSSCVCIRDCCTAGSAVGSERQNDCYVTGAAGWSRCKQ